MLSKLGLWIFTRIFQISSAGSYALAIWTWLGWPANAEGVSLIEQLLKLLLAILLFAFNEKPWLAKLKG